MSVDTGHQPDRLRSARRAQPRILRPLAGLVCDGPFAEARDYAACVLAARMPSRDGEALPAAPRDLAGG